MVIKTLLWKSQTHTLQILTFIVYEYILFPHIFTRDSISVHDFFSVVLLPSPMLIIKNISYYAKERSSGQEREQKYRYILCGTSIWCQLLICSVVFLMTHIICYNWPLLKVSSVWEVNIHCFDCRKQGLANMALNRTKIPWGLSSGSNCCFGGIWMCMWV